MGLIKHLPTFTKILFFISLTIGFAYLHHSRPFGIIGVGLLLIALTIVAYFLLAIVYLGFEWGRVNRPRFWSEAFAYTLLGIGAFGVSIIFGSYFHKKGILSAQEQLEHIIPQIEEFHENKGYYPDSLIELGIKDFENNAFDYLSNSDIYRCQHIVLLNRELIPEFRPAVDNFYATNGSEYELCIYNQDMFDSLGTIRVYYSGDDAWGTRVAYSRWDIGEGR